jgi:predicted Zn-dependent protease
MNVDAWTPEEIYLVAESGYELYLEGKIDEAMAIFEGLLVIDPGSYYCRDAMAAISLSLDRPEDAARHASELLKLAPTNSNALARRCEAYLQLGRMDAAMRDLEALARHRTRGQHAQMQLRIAAAGRGSSSLKRLDARLPGESVDATSGVFKTKTN